MVQQHDSAPVGALPRAPDLRTAGYDLWVGQSEREIEELQALVPAMRVETDEHLYEVRVYPVTLGDTITAGELCIKVLAKQKADGSIYAVWVFQYGQDKRALASIDDLSEAEYLIKMEEVALKMASDLKQTLPDIVIGSAQVTSGEAFRLGAALVLEGD